MDADKVTVTYDSIFERLMLEKGREDLQKLSGDFFSELQKYIAEKRRTLTTPATDSFSLEEKDRTARQLQNVTRMLTELYERREKKIINMSLIRSRTGADIIDTGTLLEEEKMLFDSLVAQLDYYRNRILTAILTAKPAAQMEKPLDKSVKLVRFLHPVPKFVGKELEVYGPFVEEDMANLPAEIADVLIQKGRAEEVA